MSDEDIRSGYRAMIAAGPEAIIKCLGRAQAEALAKSLNEALEKPLKIVIGPRRGKKKSSR